MAEKDHEPQETVENINTDMTQDDNPFNSDGFIGVDPQFQSPALDPRNPEGKKAEKKDEERPKAPPAPPASPVTPPK